MADRERFGYDRGGYTDQCYTAAGWGGRNPRYWLSREETLSRLNALGEPYARIGFQEQDPLHHHDFAARSPEPDGHGGSTVSTAGTRPRLARESGGRDS